MSKISNIIKVERLNRNWTQKELAALLGVTQDSISLWEKDKRVPDTNYIVALSTIFGVSTDYLLGLEDDFGAKTAPTVVEAYTAEERQIIEKYRELNHACKKLIRNTLDTLSSAANSATEDKQTKNSQ